MSRKVTMYRTPIVSWLLGLERRVASQNKWVNSALLNIVRQDFSWFALQFLRDERVDKSAREAFIQWFLATETPKSSSFPPPPEIPALAYEEVTSLAQAVEEELEDDEEPEEEGLSVKKSKGQRGGVGRRTPRKT